MHIQNGKKCRGDFFFLDAFTKLNKIEKKKGCKSVPGLLG